MYEVAWRESDRDLQHLQDNYAVKMITRRKYHTDTFYGFHYTSTLDIARAPKKITRFSILPKAQVRYYVERGEIKSIS